MISPTQRPLPDNTQHSQETDIHAPCGIRTHNPSKRAAADPRLIPRGHWDRQLAVKLDLSCSQKRILCWWMTLLPSCPGQGRLQIGHMILPVLIARQRCQHGQHNVPLLLWPSQGIFMYYCSDSHNLKLKTLVALHKVRILE